jgi:beta-glucosidase
VSTTSASPFPSDFVWGAATASYQIEGAVDVDGRGESVWDRFSRTPGKVRNGDTGDVACDFYHRYREDVGLMRELGLDAFRFSIAWPRVLPEGRGRVNERGLDFYDRLVDELLAAGIVPYATLFHWDTPQALEDAGGWPARATVDAYVEYAEAVARRLGDRVERWITHNEPWVVAWPGHGWGRHAPGRESERAALATAHHLLLSHGLAVDVLRRESPRAQVGITLNLDHVYAATEDPADAAAARFTDGFNNRWFLDPIFRGSYPDDMLEAFGADAPAVEDGDLRAISAPIDLLGINNYTRSVVRAAPDGGRPVHVRNPNAQYTDMDWEIAPHAFHDLLVRVHRDYGPRAIYVTENGAAFGDVRDHDGKIRDTERQEYVAAHLDAVARAIAQGVPMRGYFVWSLLDNFEWAWGYWKRFGLVYVDYPTLERIPKESFGWYRDFIAAHRASAERVATG